MPVSTRESSLPLAATRTDAATRLARGLGYAVNPLVLPAFLVALILGHFGADAGEITRVTMVVLTFFGLIPLGYVVHLLRRSRIASLDVFDRRRRTGPFLVGIGAAAAALAVLQQTCTTALPLVSALAALHVLNAAVLLLVNLRWKISLHTCAVAGSGAVLFFVLRTPWATGGAAPVIAAPLLYALLPLVPLLMWARVRIGAHTPLQVLAGTLFGFAVPYVELQLLLRAGYLTGL